MGLKNSPRPMGNLTALPTGLLCRYYSHDSLINRYRLFKIYIVAYILVYHSNEALVHGFKFPIVHLVKESNFALMSSTD